MKLNFTINRKKTAVLAAESDLLETVVQRAIKKVKAGKPGDFKAPVCNNHYLNVKFRISELPVTNNSEITLTLRGGA